MNKRILISCIIILIVLSGCSKSAEAPNTSANQSVSTQEQTSDISTTQADQTPPEITCAADAIGCIIGEENDFTSFITVTDDQSENITIEVDDSSIDMEKVGEYTITFTATDEAGNKASIEKLCFVEMNSSSSEIMDFLSETILDDNSKIFASVYKGYDIKNIFSESSSKAYRAFQSNIASDNCYYEIYINDDKSIIDDANGSYSGLNKLIEVETLVSNTNYGQMNLDTPWMPELTFITFLHSYDGTPVPELEKVVFRSEDKELVFDNGYFYGAGNNDINESYATAKLRTYCFKSEDEISLFSEIINTDTASVQIITKDGILQEFVLSEDNKEHFNKEIEIYNTLCSNDITRNIPLREDLTSIQYVNTESNDKTDSQKTQTNSTNKVFPGNPVKVKIKDGGITIIDNENATVKLLSMEQEVLDVKITFSVTNNRDTKFLFNLRDIYLGDIGAKSIMLDGNEGPAPGKTRSYSYYIDHEDDSQIYLKELCDLNGTIELCIESSDESYIENYDNNPFSFIDHKEEIENSLNEVIQY